MDFLPFPCSRCSGKFCAEHRTPEAHACAAGPATSLEDRRLPVCPLCGQAVPLTAADTTEALVNDRVERHILDGCPSEARGGAKGRGGGAGLATASSASAKCAFRGCKAGLMASTAVTCSQCRQRFCLAHRNELDHRCGGMGSGRGRGGGAAALPASLGPGAGGRPGRGGSRSSTALRSTAPPSLPSNVWACPSCTLHNGLSSATCAACGARRPAGGKSAPSSASDSCAVS